MGVLVCAPRPRFTQVTGGAAGCSYTGQPAVPLGQDHEAELAFSSLGLFAVFLLSLSMMSSLPPASVEELRLPSVVSQMLQETLGSS